MSCCAAVIGVALLGLGNVSNTVHGEYYSSCGTSYCRGVEVHCTHQASARSILNRPTGHGYSVTYNYGMEPDSVPSWSGSGSYNYGLK